MPLTTKQVADRLGVTASTVRGWRHISQGPRYVRFSERNIRYDERDVDAYVKRLTVDPSARASLETKAHATR